MPTAMDKALSRSRANASFARQSAVMLKKAGGGGGFMDFSPSAGMGSLSAFQDQGRNQRRYAQFHGWVHSAINALADTAAGQPVHVGKLAGSKKAKPKQSKDLIVARKDFPSRPIQAFERNKMPASLRNKAAATELEVIEDHPLLTALEKPNNMQHRWQFVYSFVANLCLTGWGYVIAAWNDKDEIEFYSVPTTWVYPDHTKGAFAEFYIRNPNDPASIGKNQKPLTRDQVGFAYIPNPSDPLSALPPIQAQSMAVAIDDSIQSSQVTFFDNAMFPSAIVTMGHQPHPEVAGGLRPRLTPAQRRQVYGAIKKVMSGVANYGNPAIIDGMIEKIERLSATQNEIGWEKSEKTVRTRILSAFGVHPFILGEEMAGSYAQAYIVQDLFCRRVNVFLSMLSTLMTNFVPNLIEKGDKEKIVIWYEEAAAKDPSMEKSLWEGARGREDVSQNEFRAFMNLPPDEDKNEAQIDKASIQAITGIAAQVKAGGLEVEQGVAILEGLGLSKELATAIAGEGPAEEDMGMGMGDPNAQGGFGEETQDTFGATDGADTGDGGGDFDAATQELEDAFKGVRMAHSIVEKSKRLAGV